MIDAFQPGDVVRLKSGGPLMTVGVVEDDDGDVAVGANWFDNDNKLRMGHFFLVQLVKFSDSTDVTTWKETPWPLPGEMQWRISKDMAKSGAKPTTDAPADASPITLGDHAVTITGIVGEDAESELARRTRLAVQHAAEKYCVGRDAVDQIRWVDLASTIKCHCRRDVKTQIVRDLEGFAYARGRCTECNRVYVAVEPVA